jgi:endonuclease YncB( thermonuclease family)
MRRLLTALLALGLVAVVAAPPALARRVPCGTNGHARCLVWTGKVTFVADGDTVDVKLDGGGGTRRVRLISINATELTRYSHKPSLRRGECHGVAATNNLERMIRRSHWRVRLLAQHASSRSLGRLLRSLQVRSGGRWHDAAAAQLRAGMALWLPKRDEPAWNDGYSVIARRAAARGHGLYDTDSCGRGPAQGARLRVHVNWDAAGVDRDNPNGEWIQVRNLDPSRAVKLGHWRVKDSDLKSYRLPSWAKVPAGGSIYVHPGRGRSHGNHFYWGLGRALFDNDQGDGGYLFDPQGDLRAWDIYDV